jgi:hypothetical protein
MNGGLRPGRQIRKRAPPEASLSALTSSEMASFRDRAPRWIVYICGNDEHSRDLGNEHA